MIPWIQTRRSIRKYKPAPVSEEDIKTILQAGILAPSSKNRQPWKFIVVSGHARKGMTEAMRQGLEREMNSPKDALLPDSRQHLKGAEHTLHIMEQAPATILIVNTLGLGLSAPLTPEERIYEICNYQSIGAAIENMTLEAAKLGLGSLWICDIFFAYRELKEWMNAEGELAAALSIGYGDETPAPRPRRPLKEVTTWRN